MRKMVLRLMGLLVLLSALISATPRPAEAKKVCNILCTVGLKCCIVRGQPTCVPIETVCRP